MHFVMIRFLAFGERRRTYPVRATMIERAPGLPEFSWSELQIRHVYGSAWAIESSARLPSRTASVHRIVLTDHAGSHRVVYLKQFRPTDTAEEFELRFRNLQAISASLQERAEITPLVVLAYDAGQRLLLTAQMEGECIIALHRRLARRFGFDARDILDAWRGVGAWLSTLHRGTLAPVVSAARADELCEYSEDRFLQWTEVDPRQQKLAQTAIDALKAITARCARVPLSLVPCHGDVSAYNILVSKTVGLIDFDDARFDLPALDLSQAVLELRNVSRLFWTFPLKSVIQSAESALLAGYGGHPPDGGEFWLPHFRNLSVYLLTLARRRSGAALSRITDELRYQSTLAELRRAIGAVERSGENASYWREPI